MKYKLYWHQFSVVAINDRKFQLFNKSLTISIFSFLTAAYNAVPWIINCYFINYIIKLHKNILFWILLKYFDSNFIEIYNFESG